MTHHVIQLFHVLDGSLHEFDALGTNVLYGRIILGRTSTFRVQFKPSGVVLKSSGVLHPVQLLREETPPHGFLFVHHQSTRRVALPYPRGEAVDIDYWPSRISYLADRVRSTRRRFANLFAHE